jgi:YidC/Oxa1 family membrane protein insertase
MRLIRPAILLAVAAVCAMAFALGGCGRPLSPLSYDKLTKRAEDNIKKAEAAKVTGDKIDYYTKAINNYEDAVGRAANDRDQREEARAYYGVATTNQALAKVYPKIGEQNKSLWAAHAAYTAIVSKFGQEVETQPSAVQEIEKKSEFQVTLHPGAKVETVANELDHRNSRYRLFGIVNLYQVIDTLVKLTGSKPAFSYWFAIILITIVVKLLLTPLTKAQFKAMKEMQKVAPLVKEIQEKYKGDQQTIGQKTMDLYKEHHINPFASCLPLLIQMPILLMLYQTIRMYQFQFEKGAFFWIGSALSHFKSVTVPVGTAGQVWVTARNLAEPDLILVLLYLVSMYVSTKLSNVDPTQAEQQKMMAILMPVMFAFLFAGFPSAFLLYWLVFNVIQTTQQYLILSKHGEPLPVPAPVPPPKPKTDTPRQPRRRRRR